MPFNQDFANSSPERREKSLVQNKMGNIACGELDLVVDVSIGVPADRSLDTDIRDDVVLHINVQIEVLLVRDVIEVALVNRLICGLQARVFLKMLGDMVIEWFLIESITIRNDTIVTSIPC